MAALRSTSGLRSVKNLLGLPAACEQFVNLHHGDAFIPFDLNKRSAGFFDALEFGNTEEMPNGVFDVGRINRLVQFELFAAFLEPASIITGDAALPVIGRLARDELEKFVEVLKRAGHVAGFEAFAAAQVVELRAARFQLQSLIEVGDGPGVIRLGRIY